MRVIVKAHVPRREVQQKVAAAQQLQREPPSRFSWNRGPPEEESDETPMGVWPGSPESQPGTPTTPDWSGQEPTMRDYEDKVHIDEEEPIPEEVEQDRAVEELAPTAPKPKKRRVGGPGEELPIGSTSAIPANSPLFYPQKMERVIVTKAEKPEKSRSKVRQERFDFDPETGEVREGYFAPTGRGTITHTEHGRRLETEDTSRPGYDPDDPKKRPVRAHTRRKNIVAERKKRLRAEAAEDPEESPEILAEREQRRERREKLEEEHPQHPSRRHTAMRSVPKEQWTEQSKDPITGKIIEKPITRKVEDKGVFAHRTGFGNDPVVIPKEDRLTQTTGEYHPLGETSKQMFTSKKKLGPSQRLGLSEVLWNYAKNTENGVEHVGQLAQMPHFSSLVDGFHYWQEKGMNKQAQNWKRMALQDVIDSIASSDEINEIMDELGIAIETPATRVHFQRPTMPAPTQDTFDARWKVMLSSKDMPGAEDDALGRSMAEAGRSFQIPPELQESFDARVKDLMEIKDVSHGEAMQRIGQEMEAELGKEPTVYDDPALWGEAHVKHPEEAGGMKVRGEEEPIPKEVPRVATGRLDSPAIPAEEGVEETPPVTDPKDALTAGREYNPQKVTSPKPRITQRLGAPKKPSLGPAMTIADIAREQGVTLPGMEEEEEKEKKDDDIQLSFEYPLGEQLLKSILLGMVSKGEVDA